MSLAPGRPGASLAESRDYCAALTKREARNFYYGLKLLPRDKRGAMFALYAYMRLVDDIADGQDGQTLSQRSDALDARESSRLFRAFGAGRLHWSRAWAMVVLGSVGHALACPTPQVRP